MRRRIGTAAAGLATAILLLGCSAAPVGHGELELLGAWTGIGDRHGDGVLEMLVHEAAADGSGFDGELTFAIDGERQTEPVRARMTPHGHLAGGVGAHAAIEMHISDPGTLDYCFARYGTDPALACARLTRR